MGLIRDLREVLKTAKRRRPSKIYCPRCGSPEIHVCYRTDVFLTTKRYLCDNCKYIGPLIMEIEKEEG